MAKGYAGLSRALAFPSGINSPGGIRCPTTAAAAEAILRLRRLPPIAGRDYPRCARRQGRVRPAAYGRREVAVLPVAGDGAGGADGRRVAADRVDEGPSGCVAGQRRASDVPQLVAGGRGIAGAPAWAPQWRIPAALRRAGEVNALGVRGRLAAVGRELAGR